MRIGVWLAISALTISAGYAQPAPRNEAGVRLAKINVLAEDATAEQRFFVAMLDGKADSTPGVVHFPGIDIEIHQATPLGSSKGAILDHFGFVFKDLDAWKVRWKAAATQIEQGQNPLQGYIYSPGGVRIEFYGDPASDLSMKFDHLHFAIADGAAMRAWYAKAFGARAGERARVAGPGTIDCVFFPGMNFSFSKLEPKMYPTKGRSIESIAFDVEDLETAIQRVEAAGSVVRRGIVDRAGLGRVQTATLTDPWGTEIELIGRPLARGRR